MNEAFLHHVARLNVIFSPGQLPDQTIVGALTNFQQHGNRHGFSGNLTEWVHRPLDEEEDRYIRNFFGPSGLNPIINLGIVTNPDSTNGCLLAWPQWKWIYV